MANEFDIRAARFGLEDTEGVAQALTAANVLKLVDGSADIVDEDLTRNYDQREQVSRPVVKIRQRLEASFGFYVAGASNVGTPSPFSALYQASGFAENLIAGPPALTQYNPVSTGIPSGTFEFYHDSEIKKAVGCRLRPTSYRSAIDEDSLMKGDLKGIVLPTGEAVIPNDDDSAFQDPIVGSAESMSMELDGFELEGLSLDLSWAGTNNLRHTTKGRNIDLRGRALTGSIKYYRPTYAQKDIRAMVGVESGFSLITKVALAGHVSRSHSVTLGRVQLGQPKTVNEDGNACWEQPFIALPTNGNDDVIFTFGDVL